MTFGIDFEGIIMNTPFGIIAGRAPQLLRSQ